MIQHNLACLCNSTGLAGQSDEAFTVGPVVGAQRRQAEDATRSRVGVIIEPLGPPIVAMQRDLKLEFASRSIEAARRAA